MASCEGRHGQRPAAAERVVEAHQAAPDQRMVGPSFSVRMLKNLVDRALLQMILQVCVRRLGGRAPHRSRAGPSQSAGPMPERCSSWTDPIAARAQDDFARARTSTVFAAPDEAHADGAGRSRRSGDRPAPAFPGRRLGRFNNRLEKAARGRPAAGPRFWLTWK